MRDPYEILGLRPGAKPAEMKAAYRKLAKRYHPDAAQGSRARFEEIAKAYELLMDGKVQAPTPAQADAAAAASDAYKTAANSTPEFTPAHAPESETGFSELFEGLRSSAKKVFSSRGDDVQYKLSVGFLEAALGARRRITLPEGRTLEIQIPAGVAESQQIRLKGQGGSGFGDAPAGDALINIAIEPHDLFRREGLDIHATLPVSLPEAVLGARVEASTIHGPVTVQIPAGSNSGTKLRLKGKGIVVGEQAGDQYFTLELRLPDKPDAAIKEFLAGWQAGKLHDPRKRG